MVSATAPLVQCWFALTGHSPVRRSLFPVCREQCRQPAGAPGLSVRDRAEPGLDRSKPALADRFSDSGDSGPGLRPGGPAIESISAMCGTSSLIADSQPAEASLTPAIWLRWLVLVFIPSSWLMGVTTYLTTDLASIPLMWIIPLALYLLSFILAFARSAAGLVRAATVVASLSRSCPSCWS